MIDRPHEGELHASTIIMTLVLFIAGLALLVVGAEILVRGASKLASAVGISPLVVGLTVVAFGTSAPEFAVSLKAAASGQGALALGNVIGSNVFNVLFILGVSALIAPLVVSRQLIRLDVPLMIGVSCAAVGLAWDGRFSHLDGLLLFTGLLVYTAFLIYWGRKARGAKNAPVESQEKETRSSWLWNVAFIVGGLVLLVVGSRWLVDSAVELARSLGLSELVIGLTLIAAGTSLPEVVTSIVASLRGARDIAVGNVVGSNLFNLLGVLGLTALVSPEGVAVAPGVLSFDLPVMIAVAFVCLPIFFTGGVISRWEGGLLLAYYVAYTTYLILAAAQHEMLPLLGAAMIYFVLPLTAVTLGVVTIQAMRRATTGSSAPPG